MKLANKLDTLSLDTPLTFSNYTSNYEVWVQKRTSYSLSIFSRKDGYDSFDTLESLLNIKFLNQSGVIDYLRSTLAVKHPTTGALILFRDYIQIFNLDITDFIFS